LFHQNIFHGILRRPGIGKADVIAAVAGKSGLDEKETLSAVRDDRYASRLNETRKEASLIGLTGVPLFVIENKYKIVGAQPIRNIP